MVSVSEIQKLIPIGMRTDDILVSKLQGGGERGREGRGRRG